MLPTCRGYRGPNDGWKFERTPSPLGASVDDASGFSSMYRPHKRKAANESVDLEPCVGANLRSNFLYDFHRIRVRPRLFEDPPIPGPSRMAKSPEPFGTPIVLDLPRVVKSDGFTPRFKDVWDGICADTCSDDESDGSSDPEDRLELQEALSVDVKGKRPELSPATVRPMSHGTSGGWVKSIEDFPPFPRASYSPCMGAVPFHADLSLLREETSSMPVPLKLESATLQTYEPECECTICVRALSQRLEAAERISPFESRCGWSPPPPLIRPVEVFPPRWMEFAPGLYVSSPPSVELTSQDASHDSPKTRSMCPQPQSAADMTISDLMAGLIHLRRSSTY